jgi:hypothetical protein
MEGNTLCDYSGSSMSCHYIASWIIIESTLLKWIRKMYYSIVVNGIVRDVLFFVVVFLFHQNDVILRCAHDRRLIIQIHQS